MSPHIYFCQLSPINAALEIVPHGNGSTAIYICEYVHIILYIHIPFLDSMMLNLMFCINVIKTCMTHIPMDHIHLYNAHHRQGVLWWPQAVHTIFMIFTRHAQFSKLDYKNATSHSCFLLPGIPGSLAYIASQLNYMHTRGYAKLECLQLSKSKFEVFHRSCWLKLLRLVRNSYPRKCLHWELDCTRLAIKLQITK